MLLQNRSGFDPVLNFIRPLLLFTLAAKVFDGRRFGVTFLAKVVEENCNFEVVWNNTAFIFADVFRTQFKFACLKVPVAFFDKGGVEHDAEQSRVGQASVFEDDLDVAMQGPVFALVLCKFEAGPSFFGQVPASRLIDEQRFDVQSMAVIDFEKRVHTVARRGGDFVELYCPEALDRRAFNLSSMEGLKVV